MQAIQEIVIRHCAVVTPLGGLGESVNRLMDGTSGLQAGPFYGVATACAPFRESGFRDLHTAAGDLIARIPWQSIDTADTIFIYCAAKGDLSRIDSEAGTEPAVSPPSPLLDRQALQVCNLLPFRPIRTITISAACASGAIGIETATELLREGACRNAVLFGFDVLSRFVVSGFQSLNALSPTGARPFDAARNGLSLGEGAGIALLTFREPQPGELIVAGAGSANDANHRTGPSRTGEGLLRAAVAALDDAGLEAAAVGAIKCHGTATPYNDAMEAKAIHTLFGEHCPPCVSFKGAIGHLSGAGSLIEILLAGECLRERRLPPTVGFDQLGVDEKIGITNRIQPIGQPVMLCLSAGFGGINAAVALRLAAP
jgi:3-oxoacyl-[acyl-carrier-protein] synthase-1